MNTYASVALSWCDIIQDRCVLLESGSVGLCVSECGWSGMVECQVLSTVLTVAITCQAFPIAAVWRYSASLGHCSCTVPANQLNVTFAFYRRGFSPVDVCCASKKGNSV